MIHGRAEGAKEKMFIRKDGAGYKKRSTRNNAAEVFPVVVFRVERSKAYGSFNSAMKDGDGGFSRQQNAGDGTSSSAASKNGRRHRSLRSLKMT